LMTVEVATAFQAQTVLRQLGNQKHFAVIAFKGASLGSSLYPSAGLRSISDIDLCIQEKDFVLASRHFESLGFHRDKVFPTQFANEMGWTLDVHFTPISRYSAAFKFPLEQAWGDSVPLFSDSPNLLRFSYEHELLISLLHASKHLFQRWIWLLDMSLLLKNCRADVVESLVREICADRLAAFAEHLLKCLDPKIKFPGACTNLSLLERQLLDSIPARKDPERLGLLLPFFSISDWSTRFSYMLQLGNPYGNSILHRLETLFEFLRAFITSHLNRLTAFNSPKVGYSDIPERPTNYEERA
jgi:hypothetical protein